MSANILVNGITENLQGRQVTEGSPAPDFRVIDKHLEPVHLADFKNKYLLLTTFPSIDTLVCQRQMEEFNRLADDLPEHTLVLGVSQDLPFALSRYSEENNLYNIFFYSDYYYRSVAHTFGLGLEKTGILARSAVIIDTDGIIQKIYRAAELTKELNYEVIIDDFKNLISEERIERKADTLEKCVPCNGQTPVLNGKVLTELKETVNGWKIVNETVLEKVIPVADFTQAVVLAGAIGENAEAEGHHPDLELGYHSVKVKLSTHKVHGLTQNDFILARIIDHITL